MVKINPSEITPEEVYLSRRRFVKGAGALIASSLILAACGGQNPTTGPSPAVEVMPTAGVAAAGFPTLQGNTDELGASLTTYEGITNYCNFYEFTPRKEGVAKLAQNFRTSPWTVEVGGLVEVDEPDPLRSPLIPVRKPRNRHALKKALSHPLVELAELAYFRPRQ